MGKRKLVFVAIGFMLAGIFPAFVSTALWRDVQIWQQPGVLYTAEGTPILNHILRPSPAVINRCENASTMFGIGSIILIVIGIGFMVHALVPERWKFKK
jgi:hypothetical protein